MRHFRILSFAASLSALILIAATVGAAPPTEEAIEKWIAEGVWEEKVDNWKAFKAAGGNAPSTVTPVNRVSAADRLALDAAVADTVHVLLILVDFSDFGSEQGAVDGQVYQMDSILFSDRESDVVYNPTGSMTDFYMENSYGTFYLVGDIYGWYQMPETYEYYVADNNGMTNGQTLARHAVEAAAPAVPDFSIYDTNEDGYCDGLIVVHAGAGAETGVYGVWSHKWRIDPAMTLDGVIIEDYTMNPEEYQGGLSPIGVFCHEYGHFLGLPDLYDIDYEPPGSVGMGNWALMSGGSYNGSSRKPSQMIGWSKSEVGFLDMIEVTGNMNDVEFPCVEYNPVVYKLGNEITGPDEYWVVENRQLVAFDGGIPHPGLCIYHVDDNNPGSNYNYLWYHVAMEQSDGQNDLALGGGRGDAGDPWPGATWNRSFHELSVPNTNTNDSGVNAGAPSHIGVWNVTDSDSIMTADLDLSWSRPYVVVPRGDSIWFDDTVGGDGDGHMEAGETIRLYCFAANYLRTAYNARLSLATPNTDIEITVNDVLLADEFGPDMTQNYTAIEFAVASDVEPTIDSFFVTITADSLPGIPGSEEYTYSFGLEENIGAPLALIVDADRGDDYEQTYRDAVYKTRTPYTLWEKDDKGAPTGDDLAEYPMVMWLTGDSAESAITAADIEAMKSYLDRSGRLLLSTISGALDMDDLDPAFMQNYFGATLDGSTFFPRVNGVAGNPVGDDTYFSYAPWPPATQVQILAPAGSGQPSHTMLGMTCGMTVDSTFKTVLLSFPVEYISDGGTGKDHKDTLIVRSMAFFQEGGPCCLGMRGNVDNSADDLIDISDIMFLIDFMFQSGSEPACWEESDINGDGTRDISDLMHLVDYAFQGGPPPVACP